MKTIIALLMLSAWLLPAAGPVVDLKNRVATISDRDGKRYENVRLSRLDENGLMYFYTNSAGGGRMKVGQISIETMVELGISNEVAALFYRAQAQAEDAAFERRAALNAAEKVRAQAEVDQKRQKVEDTISENIGRGKIYEEFTTSAAAVEIKVGLAWSGLTLKEKEGVASAALVYGRMKHPACEVVRIKNVYTGATMGRYFLKQGLDLK